MSDFVRDLGPRLLGTRIRRLSEAVDRAVTEIYGELDVRFEPRWAALLNLLSRRPSVTVTEAAAWLGQSHVAVVHVVTDLLNEGLIEAALDASDRRKRNLRLSAAGKRLVKRLEPLWAAIAAEGEALVSHDAPRLLEQLELLEAALQARPLADRFRARLGAPKRSRGHPPGPAKKRKIS